MLELHCTVGGGTAHYLDRGDSEVAEEGVGDLLMVFGFHCLVWEVAEGGSLH